MDTQNFKMTKDQSQTIFWWNLQKTKGSILLFPAIFSILMLFSCKKSANELPGRYDSGENVSAQSSGADITRSEEFVSYDQTLFVPCANGGAGEEVALTGSLKIVDETVYNSHGFTLNYHVITEGITGIGLSSGEKFVASGGIKGTIAGEYGEEGRYLRVFIQQLRIIGQNSVFKVVYKTKITVTPDGKVTTSIQDETIDCNG